MVSPHTWSFRQAEIATGRSMQARSRHKLGKFQTWMENYAFFMKINNRGGTLLCRRFHKTELMNDEEDSYC